MSTTLSIIIISYNTKKITHDCLESVYTSLNDASFSFEIVVIDNASTDGSIEMLKSFQKHSNFRLIMNPKNVGFGIANNQAVKEAKGTYILLLNSDTIVLDNAIGKLMEYYQKHEDTVQFLGPKLLNADKTPQPSAAHFYTLFMTFAALFLRGDYWEFTRFSPNKICLVDWVVGACILTKKAIYEELGGFDEKIFMYMEEVDLLYRASKRGYKTWFTPEARIIHLGSASSGQRTYPVLQVYRGFLFFYHKHYNNQLTLFLLKSMLKLKAVVGVAIGKLTHKPDLTKRYEEAYNLVTMD